MSKVALHEYEKALKVKDRTEKLLDILWMIGQIACALIILASLIGAVMMAWGVNWMLGLGVLVFIVVGAVTIVTYALNEKADNIIYDAKKYGVVDE